MVPRFDIEGYLCEKFLDLMEEKSFYQIKVTELVRYADVSRSAFYAHFDSIWDVIQKIEDDFFDEWLVDDDEADTLFRTERSSELYEQVAIIAKNVRTIRLLLGPHGDSSFEARLESRFMRLLLLTFDRERTDLTKDERTSLATFFAGGFVSTMRWWVRYGNTDDPRELFRYVLVEFKAIGSIVDEKNLATSLKWLGKRD